MGGAAAARSGLSNGAGSMTAGLQRYARIAGATYLISMALYVASTLYVAGLDVRGDFAGTARNVAAAEPWYRLALAGQAIGVLTIVVIAWCFYMLVRPVSRGLAQFALLCRTIEAGLMALGLVFWFVALRVYTGAGDLATRELLDELLTRGISASFHIAMVFLSIGSAIFFGLMFKARLIPRLLAGFDVLACALALGMALTLMIAPRAVASFGLAGWAPIFLAEVGTGLWLLIMGANFRYREQRGAAG
jgi:hypothetical protein